MIQDQNVKTYIQLQASFDSQAQQAHKCKSKYTYVLWINSVQASFDS